MLTVQLMKRLKYYNGLIHCPRCHKPLHLYDNVNMDITNTLTHSNCFNPIKIKDAGTYREILIKYPDYYPGEE